MADIREFVETGVAGILQVDLTQVGGFLPMKCLARAIRSSSIFLFSGSFCAQGIAFCGKRAIDTQFTL